jgi:hypothetical protein
MEPLLKSTITKGQDAISKAWSSATNESNKSRSIFGLGLCVGLLSALMISSIFSSRSREITSEAWVLTVTLRFKTVADKESFNGFFVPLSQFVRKTETGCLSYIVSESDKDPKQLCTYKMHSGKLFNNHAFNNNNDQDVNIYTFPPTEQEIDREKHLPRTRTGANALLGTSTRAKRWGALTMQMWQIPADHPRQQKQYCVNLAKEAGEDSVPKAFYMNESISAVSTFYLLHMKGPTMVHDIGIVAKKCGYHQAHEGCETKFKFVGRRWHSNCMSNSTSQGKKWEELFPPVLTTPIATTALQLSSSSSFSDAGNTNDATLISTENSHMCFPHEVSLS